MTEPDDFNLSGLKLKGLNPLSIYLVAPRQKSGQKNPIYEIFEKKRCGAFLLSDEYEPLLNEHDGVIKYLREGKIAIY